jgi:hypothetical protein
MDYTVEDTAARSVEKLSSHLGMADGGTLHPL